MTEPQVDVTALGALLDSLATGATGLLDIDTSLMNHLREITPDSEAQPTEEVKWLRVAHDAVAYMQRVSNDGVEFEPYLVLADQTTRPEKISNQPDEVVAMWSALRDAVQHHAWRSRLGHLVVHAERVITGKPRVDLAASVIADYLSTPFGWGIGLDRADALRSAAGLARQFRLTELRTAALDAIVQAARADMDGGSPGAGVVLGYTDYLVHQRDAPSEVDDLLDQARAVWGSDIHNLDHVFIQQLARVRADNDRRALLHRERVQAWLDAAEAADGMVRAAYLGDAVQRADLSGDAALRQLATRRLQEITMDDLGFSTFTTGMILRGEQIAQMVRPITEAEDWGEALDVWSSMLPPSGSATSNRAYVAEQMPHGISMIIPQTMVGGDGLPRFTATTDAERFDYHLARHEILNIQLSLFVTMEGLLRLPVHHGIPPIEELAGYFARAPHVPDALAFALARSFHRWWAGDYEGAAMSVVPRLEAMARNLLLLQNAPLYRVQRQATPGQYPGLGALLAMLESERLLDDTWFRYLHTVLTNSAGWNIRNEMSHGFLDGFDARHSALLLNCGARLAILPLLLEARTSQGAAGPDHEPELNDDSAT